MTRPLTDNGHRINIRTSNFVGKAGARLINGDLEVAYVPNLTSGSKPEIGSTLTALEAEWTLVDVSKSDYVANMLVLRFTKNG